MTDSFLCAQWGNLIMANYEVNPAVLVPYLPNGVEIDLVDNTTYVSLVGFMFKNSRLFHIPIPFFGTFEEVNLRFYVKRIEKDSVKRGVVFINEIVPIKMVAWLANKLYKEHYTAVPTKNSSLKNESTQDIKYEWKINKQWNHLSVTIANKKETMNSGSMEEFIFEHYYGYTKINGQLTQEYKVNHPVWQVNKVLHYSIQCDFTSLYGENFSFLHKQTPQSVLFAEGSQVSVDWKRTTF